MKANMKKTIYLILTALLLLTGCYKEEFEQIDIEMKDLVDAKINPLEAQVAKINESLGSMYSLSEELKSYIAALEQSSEGIQGDISQVNEAIQALKSSLSEKNDTSKGEILAKLDNAKAYLELQLSNVNTIVQELKTKYDSLVKQAEDLETLVADKYADKEWIDATFVTLDAQKEVIADVESVKKLVSTLNASSLKIESDIKSFIEDEIKETQKDCEAEIAEMVANITKDYTEAIAKAVEDLKEAYTPEISSAISELETSIMSWVSEALDDYYTVAAAEAQIEVFKALIGNVPDGSSLQGQIDDLTGNLETVKAELSDAYSEAISSAITESEGKLKDALEEMILGIRNGELKNITEKVSSLENDVDKLWESLNALEGRINTLDEQVLAIKNTLKILSDLNISLKEYILGVEEDIKGQNATEAAALKELLESLKTAVNGPNNDASLQNLISKLKSYVGTIPADETDVVSWVKNSIATMDKAFETYATLDYVNGLKNEIDLIVKDHSSRLKNISDRLGTAIADSRTTVDSWISEKLGSYCDKIVAQGKLNSLETTLKELFSKGDSNLEGQITALSEEVRSTISELNAAVGDAISTAITELNGFVSSSVTDALKDALATLDELDGQATAIENTIAGILTDIESLNNKISTLKDNISQLKTFIDGSGYMSLKNIVDAIAANIEALDGLYASLEKFNEINDAITGDGGYAAEIEKLKKMVDDIKTAEDTIENFNELAKDFDLDKDNLKVIVDEITADLEKLKTTVFGDGTKPGLRKQLDDINTAIEKINERIEKLNNDILKKVKEFTSIVYDSQGTNNGKVMLEYDGTSSYTGNLDYDVRPKAIASTVASVATIQYISTPVRSSLNLTKAKAEITGNNDNGKITAKVTLPADDVTEGLSVALFAGDFSSEFVGIYTTKKTDERIYCSPPSLYFQDGASGTQTVKLYYSSSILLPSINIEKPGWITVTSIGSIMTEGDMYVREYKIEVSANTDSALREGNVKFTIPRRIGSDISTTLTVKQGGREKQTIRDFSPESGSLKFTWDGKVIDEDGEIPNDRAADITVITSDGEADWTVKSSSDWASVSKNDNKARLSIKNSIYSDNYYNTTGADREGTLVFTPVGGDPVEYKFTQLKRDQTDISVTIGGQTVEKIILNYDGTGYKTSDDATEWVSTSGGLNMTVTTGDGGTDWTPSLDPQNTDWIRSQKISSLIYGIYLQLNNIGSNSGTEDRSVDVVISYEGVGEIGRIPVTQLCRRPTTVTTEDPHYLFSYDAKKYRDYTVEPENWTSISDRRIDNISINTGDGTTDWTVSSDQTWLKAEYRNGSLRLTAEVSQNTEAREATITFSCGDYQIEGQEMEWTVKQEASPAQTFTFDRELNFPDYKAGSITSTVTAEPDVEWTVSLADPDNGWLTVKKNVKDNGRYANPRYENQVVLTATRANDGSINETNIRISYGNGKYIDYPVTQPARGEISIKSISPEILIISNDAKKYSTGDSFRNLDKNSNKSTDVSVSVNNAENNEWESQLTEGGNWVTISQRNGGVIRITPNKSNESGEERSAVISFIYKETGESFGTWTFTQQARSPQTFNSITPNITGKEYTFAAQTERITVVANDDPKYDWTVSVTGDGVSYEKNNNVVTLKLSENNSGADRDGSITFTAALGGATQTFNFTQRAKPSNVNLTFSPASPITFEDGRANRTNSITVTPDPSDFTDWSVNTGTIDGWLEVTRNGNVLTLKALSNNPSSENERTATLTFTAPGFSQNYTVTQPPFSLTLEVNPSTIYFSGDGKKYKTSENSNWNNTEELTNSKRQHQYYYVPVEVTLSDQTNNWDIAQSSSWSGEKNGSTLRVKPSENLTWSAEKPSGKITVQSTADESITKDITIVQNRPLTVTSSTSNNTATFTVRSDSNVTISWGRNLTVKINGETQSQSSRTADLNPGDSVTVTSSSNSYYRTITFTNTEGSSVSKNVRINGNVS